MDLHLSNPMSSKIFQVKRPGLNGMFCMSNLDSWNKLIDVVEVCGEIEQIKQTYEALLEVYPNTLSSGNSILPSSDGANTSPTRREAASKAYGFSLSHISQDKDSGDIWSDYIRFLRLERPPQGTSNSDVLLPSAFPPYLYTTDATNLRPSQFPNFINSNPQCSSANTCIDCTAHLT
ncbi:hypothetical protein EDB19DRAFT_1914849 [Suillus lakei]|nr:hypothetical protein EDB19DRAFT_1914849 [Suillus lakei]